MHPASLTAVAARAALTLAVAVAGCVGDPDPMPTAMSQAPIINGTYEDGDDAVVGLAFGNSMSRDELFCTGTLVSPHVVVAAGHCVTGGPPPAYVYFGSDPASEGTFVRVASAIAHPDFDPNQLTSDISVVVLADPAPAGVTAYPMATGAPSVDAAARFVGFGCRTIATCGPYGQKYQVTMPITQVNPADFQYGVATCNGDSGGPAFVTENGREVLEGVTSWGDQDCSQFGVDTRVDTYADWVREQIAAADPGSADGSMCASDTDCASGVCEGTCRALCDPSAPLCSDGASCNQQASGAYACADGTSAGGCGCRVGRGQGQWPGQGGPAGAVGLGALGLLLAAAGARRAKRRDRG